ncbi:MAG: phosphate signaling complex protein PhoU [Ktedonobacteraceae bacterium]
MPRSILDRELHELDDQVQRLGALVVASLEKALEALGSGDLATAGLVIESEAAIDSLRTTIEEHAIRLLILQQPLGGRDLRYLTSALAIATDLERAGDATEGIAQILLRMLPLGAGADILSSRVPLAERSQVAEAAAVRSLLELGREAERILQGTMKALANFDAKAARYIWQEDDVVDTRYNLVRNQLVGMMEGAHAIPALQHDSLALQRLTYLLWIAHKLERIGDHSANICERVVFTVEGERIMHNNPPA